MKTYELNLRFETDDECRAWEQDHIINRKYNGEAVLMVNHEVEVGSDWVILRSIITIA